MRLFVYGSLKRGFSNHAFLRGQRFLGVRRTLPAYHLHDCGGYPGAVSAPPGRGDALEGELWEIDAACRRRIDWLEETEAGVYRLEPCALETAPEGEAESSAWIYLYGLAVPDLPSLGAVWPPERDRHPPVSPEEAFPDQA
jgi:gamma-glutamylcyclotransferase (GGCT)/AIG2-like uncharacterized protein YtfP